MTARGRDVDAAEDALFGPDRRGDEPPDGMSGRGAAGRADRGPSGFGAAWRRSLPPRPPREPTAAEQAAGRALPRGRPGPAGSGPGNAPRGVDPVAVAEAKLDRLHPTDTAPITATSAKPAAPSPTPKQPPTPKPRLPTNRSP